MRRMKPMIKATVSVRGQVALPIAVRQRLGIQIGDRVMFQFLDDGGVRMQLQPKQKAGMVRKMLGFARKFRKTRPSTDWFD